MTFTEFTEMYVSKYAVSPKLMENPLTVRVAFSAKESKSTPKKLKEKIESHEESEAKQQVLNAIYELIYFHRRWNAGLVTDPKEEWVIQAIGKQGGRQVKVCTPLTPWDESPLDPGEYVPPEGVVMVKNKRGQIASFDGEGLSNPETRKQLVEEYTAYRHQKSAFKKSSKVQATWNDDPLH